MTSRDGDDWAGCGLGHRHWGRFGGAGLLLAAPAEDGTRRVLLQRRRRWASHGSTWGPPGGARDSHESAIAAALRESAEECGIPASAVAVHGELRDDHGGWSYSTTVATASHEFPVRPAAAEISTAAWINVADVESLALHPGFAGCWPVLREALDPVAIIVDAANVMGSRPDGWWRDRAGAGRRLRDQLAALATTGLAALPEAMAAPLLDRWYPQFVLVAEGAARAIADDGAAGGPGGTDAVGSAAGAGGWRPAPSDGRLRVVAARGSGDDLIAQLAGSLPGRRLVVTADRELRGRCAAAGTSVTGPGWLLGLL